MATNGCSISGNCEYNGCSGGMNKSSCSGNYTCSCNVLTNGCNISGTSTFKGANSVSDCTLGQCSSEGNFTCSQSSCSQMTCKGTSNLSNVTGQIKTEGNCTAQGCPNIQSAKGTFSGDSCKVQDVDGFCSGNGNQMTGGKGMCMLNGGDAGNMEGMCVGNKCGGTIKGMAIANEGDPSCNGLKLTQGSGNGGMETTLGMAVKAGTKHSTNAQEITHN